MGGIEGGFYFVRVADFLEIDIFDIDAELFPVGAELFEKCAFNGFAVAVNLESFVAAED